MVIRNTGNETLNLRTLLVSNYYDYQEIFVQAKDKSQSNIISPDQVFETDLMHSCIHPSNNNNYWSILNVRLVFVT